MDNAKRMLTVTALKERDLQLQPGQRFALRYDILEPLNRDGNGALYLARDRHSGRELHLHILMPRR